MLPVLVLGSLSLPIPEFVLLIGFWVGTYVADRKAKIVINDPTLIDRILWTSLLAGLIGSRLSYFARNSSAFSGDILSIFSLNFNLFDPIGGLLIALTTGIYIISKSNSPFLKILDSLTPFFAIFIGAIHLSNFASGAGYGSLTNLPWGINLWGGIRHPVQLYYFFGSLAALGLSLYLLNKYSYTQGVIFFAFTLFSSTYLLIFSKFEFPNALLFDFRINQIIFWFVILISLLFLNKIHFSNKEAPSHEIKE